MVDDALHSTMFLLIRYPGEPVQRKNGPLHSTMFLLILTFIFTLTFQYVLYIPQCFY